MQGAYVAVLWIQEDTQLCSFGISKENTQTTTGDNERDLPGYLSFLSLVRLVFFSISKHSKIHILHGKSFMYSLKNFQFQK